MMMIKVEEAKSIKDKMSKKESRLEEAQRLKRSWRDWRGDEPKLESEKDPEPGHLHKDDEELEQKRQISYPESSDPLEVGQPGLDNTISEKNGAYNDIPLESNAPSKAGHLHIRERED